MQPRQRGHVQFDSCEILGSAGRIGGSVAELPGLFPLVRAKLVETLAGYGALPEHAADDFVVPAGLGGLAGPAGALVLAENALLAADG